MTINGFWKTVKPAGQEFTLLELCEANGYSFSQRNRGLRIGIDISIVMNQCLAASSSAGQYGQRKGGPILILFYKLCRLLRAPVNIMCVFDGPQRPAGKRGRILNLQSVPSWKEDCKELIEAFGFHHYEAPGEAEAELAKLNSLGLIDAIITDDGDAFAMGAQCVLRKTSEAGKYKVYLADVLENVPDVSLTRGGAFLMALMSGNDYSQGIRGCGHVVSHGLAKCGFGDEILNALETLSGTLLEETLHRIFLCIKAELASNSRGYLTQKQPQLANTLPESFMTKDSPALNLYLNPVTSWSLNPQHGLNPKIWAVEPCIPRIAHFCHANFGWKSQHDLEIKFRRNLWEGIFLQMLYSKQLLYDPSIKTFRTSHLSATILNAVFQERFNSAGLWGRIAINTDNFAALMGFQESSQDPKKICIWVQDRYFPSEFVETFRKKVSKPANLKTSAAPTSVTSIVASQDPPIASGSNSSPHILDLTIEVSSASEARGSDRNGTAILDLTSEAGSAETPEWNGEVLDLTMEALTSEAWSAETPEWNGEVLDLTMEPSTAAGSPEWSGSLLDLTAEASD